jgi:hypothetical protein
MFGVQSGQTVTPLQAPISVQCGSFVYTISAGVGVGGFVVNSTDGLNPTTILSATIVSDSQVLLQLDRKNFAPPVVGFADSTHLGKGNLWDSDPMTTDVPYVYAAGSGMPVLDNITALVGNPMPLWNPCMLFFKQSVAG